MKEDSHSFYTSAFCCACLIGLQTFNRSHVVFAWFAHGLRSCEAVVLQDIWIERSRKHYSTTLCKHTTMPGLLDSPTDIPHHSVLFLPLSIISIHHFQALFIPKPPDQ